MKNIAPIKICIVEDDALILKSLQQVLNNAEGFQVTGTFFSAEAALEILKDHCPDVLLLDIDLPGISGIEAISKLKHLQPELNIVMLTVHEESELVFSALRNGAVGYLVKGSSSKFLLQGIQDVYEGGAPMSPSIARQVIASFTPQTEHVLSDRELEVLEKLSSGTNNRQIAEDLFVSTNTVKAHIKNIYKKLHVNSRAEAVSKAIKKGWI
ncbi:MAG TPA: response regulator transcription factor [Flavobacteriaceae bacterium]|jgi:DNA-binding NarL/FixJ family response regulator|nr:DNA-binding response regulator [Flavobacteriaceae bacterium]MAM28435.1 DNA-binding response regulator [Flavobacteriaceae bacterium]HIB48550.1 response regulator transcription factor [Flavobacteriaceae bacterium]HIN97884.1 response regulator transcription factor [Flavobacteriaceae bacterium]|tara:strand:+ start:82149 stop:82781 length:633 start_codon:yes stop_codon:yes gene_type:complete